MRCLRILTRKLAGSCLGRIFLLIMSSLVWVWTLSVVAELRLGEREETPDRLGEREERPVRLEDRKEKPAILVSKIEPTLNSKVLPEYNKVKEIMEERTETMKDACRKHGLDTPGTDPLHKMNPWEYFINQEHSLVWCNVFKSASTSWMYIFNVLSGYSHKFLKKTKKVPLNLARAKYPRPSADELRKVLAMPNVTSVIIGRNPFERLVSAYKDKILGALPGSFHDKMRREITHKYRKVKVPRIRKLQPEFIPTFREFVEFIVWEHSKGNAPEMHWAPVYSFCNPCQVNINSIAKFETLSADTEFILSKIKASENMTVEKKNSSKDGKNAGDVTAKYLKQLDRDLYNKLVQLYVIDFDIFGYQVPDFETL